MIRMRTRIFSAVAAASGFVLAGPALAAAGGSEDGAVRCAYAAMDETGRDYTHVTRSVRRGYAVEDFWLTTGAGDAPRVHCRYNRRDDAVEFVEVEV